ncbi:MAG: hypothetical protein ACP5L0_01690 [Caldisphaera sp.]|uniref:hypothetical protein n=1 Tax=Caldisphaera sp. TaxID=2060322 RepID=UPI003D0FB23C
MHGNSVAKIPKCLRESIDNSKQRKVVYDKGIKKQIITFDNPNYVSASCRCGSGIYCCYCNSKSVCVAACQSGPNTWEEFECAAAAGQLGYCPCATDSDCTTCCCNYCPVC